MLFRDRGVSDEIVPRIRDAPLEAVFPVVDALQDECGGEEFVRAAHRESFVPAMLDAAARRDVEHADPEPAAMGLFEIGEAGSNFVGIRLRESVSAREKRSGEKTAKEESAT
jgi:hypothetical protein